MDEWDSKENSSSEDKVDVQSKLEKLREKKKSYERRLESLKESGEGQISTTDPDARLLSKSGQLVAGYNVQIAVDEKHKLIVAGEITSDGNDSAQLYPMSGTAKSVLGVDKLSVVADKGYYQQDQIKDCIENGITPYVSKPNKSTTAKRDGRYTRDDFQYEKENNRYQCPNGEYLSHVGTEINRGKTTMRYKSQTSVCRTCLLREKCLPKKTSYRQIHRWVHEDIIEEHEKRMAQSGNIMIRKRGAMVEHPFGTIKLWCGWNHFLVRGKQKVSGEWNLLMLCYNFKRVLKIMGHDKFRQMRMKKISPLKFVRIWILQKNILYSYPFY